MPRTPTATMTATPHGLSTLGATDEKVEIVTMEDVNDIEKVTVGINSDPTVIKSTTRKVRVPSYLELIADRHHDHPDPNADVSLFLPRQV